MTHKFTPGPWAVNETDGGEWEVIQPDPSKPTPEEPWYIALVHDAANDGSAEANARLIAAAPELLEALEAVELARNSDLNSDWQRATELTVKALRRARGETA